MAFEIAIPEDDSFSFGDYLDALKRRRKPALIIALTLLVLGSIGIVLWPNAYTSTAVILIEDPDIPPGLVPSTVVTYASKQIQYINQRVMTRTNLAGIIEKFDLFATERKYMPTLLLVPDVEKHMNIDVIDAQGGGAGGAEKGSNTIAFKLSFENKNPETARAVANELVSLYLAENVRSRTEKTAQTSQFMQEEVDRLDLEVRDLENQIAKIKSDNEGSLPELMAFNMSVVDRLTMDIQNVERQLQSTRENKIMLDAQLAQLNPVGSKILSDGSAITAPEDQLKALQTKLAMMEGRYSADHPDVLRVKRDLAAVKGELGTDVETEDTSALLTDARMDLAKAREKYGPDHPEVKTLQRRVTALEQKAAQPPTYELGKLKADNPIYIQLRAQREQLESSERALVTEMADLRVRRAEIEKKAMRSSDVEKDLSALYRRLNTATASYQAARDKSFVSKMGQALETQSKGERFALVEPPDLPLLPSSPNRPVLLALLIVLVLAAGLGWPQVAESMDEAIYSSRAIERVQGAPPIAEIPLITTALDREQQRKVRVGGLLIAPVVILIILTLIHFFVIRLDVLWYVGLRRFGGM